MLLVVMLQHRVHVRIVCTSASQTAIINLRMGSFLVIKVLIVMLIRRSKCLTPLWGSARIHNDSLASFVRSALRTSLIVVIEPIELLLIREYILVSSKACSTIMPINRATVISVVNPHTSLATVLKLSTAILSLKFVKLLSPFACT